MNNYERQYTPPRTTWWHVVAIAAWTLMVIGATLAILIL